MKKAIITLLICFFAGLILSSFMDEDQRRRKLVDNRVAVIPDFIANCGMARTFAYLMNPIASLEDEDIFTDISETIEKAMRRTRQRTAEKVGLWQQSLNWVLEDLL